MSGSTRKVVAGECKATFRSMNMRRRSGDPAVETAATDCTKPAARECRKTALHINSRLARQQRTQRMNSRATKNTKSPSGDSHPAPKSIGGGGLGACIGRLGAFRSARFQPLRGGARNSGRSFVCKASKNADSTLRDGPKRRDLLRVSGNCSLKTRTRTAHPEEPPCLGGVSKGARWRRSTVPALGLPIPAQSAQADFAPLVGANSFAGQEYGRVTSSRRCGRRSR